MRPEHEAAHEQDQALALPTAEPLPDTTQQRLLSLQQRVGNVAFGRMVDRWKAGKAILAREDIPSDAEILEAETWAAGGKRSVKDLTPGNPGAGLNNAPGGFDASYDPKKGELTIIMRCGVEFVDGIARDGKAAKGLEKQLERIKKLPEIQRETELAKFRWDPAEDHIDKQNFNKDVETTVEPFWSGKHQFFMRKKGWSWLGATVTVDLKVDNKSRVPDSHMTIKPVKVPSNVSIGANVEPGQPGNARDQVMNVSSNVGDQGSFLQHSVNFAVGSSAIVGQQALKLNNIVKTFKGAESSKGVADDRSIQTPVVLTGHASATGDPERNQILSEQRAQAVSDFMKAKGFVNVETRVSGAGFGDTFATGGENAHERRVDIVIGSGGAQNTMRHEFGHAFGLGDEYASTPLVSPNTGRDQGVPQMGDDATHDNLVKNMIDAGGTPLKGAVCEPTDSIMSVGDVVRPQHYATFHAALTKATEPHGPWALGPPTGQKDPLPGAAAPGTTAPAPDAEPVPV